MILDNLRFKFTWRSYQQKFLDGFEEHIKDDHLHVIAPPGSGKTILGLEMLIRIGKPSLILAPTLTIRNQWRSRLLEFFMEHSDFKGYSMDIKAPNHLTFSTYQSLFSLSKSFNGNSKTQLLAFFKRHNIETLVLDEAHHLKNEWWHCLFHLKAIEGLTIISLTATPPYDSSALELDRYFNLCGPVDDEIAVPDLIQNGDLCPHQDFVYFSKPAEDQIRYIVKYREEILNFTTNLLAKSEFQEFLLGLDLYKNPKKSLDYIYQYPSFYSSIIIYLKSCGVDIKKQNLEILGFSKNEVDFPSFTYEWSEHLLQNLLVDQRKLFIDFENLLLPLEKELKRIGVLEHKRVNFVGDEVLYRNLSNSPSKLESIYQIFKNTYNGLGNKARIVVLADFIRKEFLSFKGVDTSILNKLGVVPIFKYILARDGRIDNLAVLTGTLVILHESALDHLKQMLDMDVLKMRVLEGSNGYVIIQVSNNFKNRIAEAVTQLFEQGIIRTLIGTKAFLGEGWDAPCLNTLILASYVGSFVSSNQMRGRAIRVDANNLNKTGVIWHLACLDPTSIDGGKDIEKLKQRFNAFTGVSLRDEVYISNGLDRLVLPLQWGQSTDMASVNQKMLLESLESNIIKKRWAEAIKNGKVLVRELQVPYKNERSFSKAKRLYALNAGKYVLLQVLAGVALFIPEFLAKNISLLLGKGLLQLVYVFLGGLILGFGPKTVNALKLYFLFGNQFKKTKKIGGALLMYLKNNKLISTDGKQALLCAEQYLDGTFSIYLKNANQQDCNLFISMLDEIIAPVDNPRYLLINGNWLKRKLGVRNYYVVPKDIGKNKTEAEKFQRLWNYHVDGSKMLFTRTLKGRKELLKARFSHVKYQFEEAPKMAITWK